MRIIDDYKLDFSDVLLVPKRSVLASRSEVDLVKTYTFKNSGMSYTGVPIIAANMDGVGTFAMSQALAMNGLATALVKHYSYEELYEFFKALPSTMADNVIYSMGATEDDYSKYLKLRDSLFPVKHVCIDVANGYSEKFINFVSKFREENPLTVLIAGNVATPEITEELILAGADIIKVGIGSGNACSTRIKTGIGYPQLSAIIECADAAHGLGGHIVGDGGITCPGDVVKAFAANADFVMIGSLLSGHTEGGGKVEQELVKTNIISNVSFSTGYLESTPKYHERIESKEYVEFYGMSSQKAQETHGSSLKDYRASEGRVLRVPFKGPVSTTIQDILGGLRSACTYSGAKSLKELPKRATFVKVHQQVSALYGIGKL